MELKSFQFNEISWRCRVLGEQAILLEPNTEKHKLSAIHHFSKVIDEQKVKGVVEIVPSYESLAVIFDTPIKSHNRLVDLLQSLPNPKKKDSQSLLHEIPVCYELGLDWGEITQHSGITKERFIQDHFSKIYTVAMMGFIPGFVFLEGLKKQLSVPRKASPRTNLPAGSVGIGGNQTGIYSLESPGGWNIIGRTPSSFFDVKKNPPTKLKAGDKIKFKAISNQEFLSLTQ